MRKIIFIFLIINTYTTYSQVDFGYIEQISFQFYQDSILPKHPSRRRIKIPKYAYDFYSTYGLLNSNQKHIRDENKEKKIEFFYDSTLIDFDDFCVEMKYSNQTKKYFKIKQRNHKKYPFLTMYLPYKSTYGGKTQSHITISEHQSDRTSIEYQLILDENWKVLSWKRNVITYIRSH